MFFHYSCNCYMEYRVDVDIIFLIPKDHLRYLSLFGKCLFARVE